MVRVVVMVMVVVMMMEPSVHVGDTVVHVCTIVDP